jgi:hypothetical protein
LVADLIGGSKVKKEEWKEGSGHEIFIDEDEEEEGVVTVQLVLQLAAGLAVPRTVSKVACLLFSHGAMRSLRSPDEIPLLLDLGRLKQKPSIIC